jgi:hypothetical protein
MAKLIKIKRGTDADRQNVVFALGEPVWTTDKEELWIGDGQTVGGIKVTSSAESNYIPNAEKGAAGGVATLDNSGKLPSDQLPPLSITSVYVVDDENEQLNLNAQEGDVSIRTDENKNYIHNNNYTGTMADWTELAQVEDSVSSVNGQTGTVVLKLLDLDDVVFTDLENEDVLQYDGANQRWVNVDSSTIGSKTFILLEDTPTTYVGEGGKIVVVGDTEDKLIFTDTIDGGSFDGTSSTLANMEAGRGLKRMANVKH